MRMSGLGRVWQRGGVQESWVRCARAGQGRAGLEGYKRLHQDAPRATVRPGMGWRGSTVQGTGIRETRRMAGCGGVGKCGGVWGAIKGFTDVSP